MKIDEKDMRILGLLKENGALSTSRIAKSTRMPITTVHNRIEKLKREGVIRRFTVEVDYGKIGKPLAAYILLTANQNLSSGKKTTQQEIGRKIKAHEEVESVDVVTGTTDMIIKLRVASMGDLNRLLTTEFRKIDGVDKTQTLMVLEEIV